MHPRPELLLTHRNLAIAGIAQVSFGQPSQVSPMPYRSVACLDGRNDCGRVGPTDALEVHGAPGQQVVDAALEAPRRDMGMQVRARARGVRADVAVARQRVGRDVKLLGGPGEREGGSVELGLRHILLVEVSFADDEVAFGRWAADQIAAAIEMEGPDTVAAVFLEPVQNSGGCFPPPPGYFARVREICDRYDVLMVSDEVICAFGRLGHMFGAQRYGYEPDIITCAKGITSGYSPLGAMLVTDRVYEPFATGAATFMHGYTFGGHPVSCAVALANLDVMEKDGLLDHVQANEAAFRSTLERLRDLPIVGDVRGAGYFYGIEMVKDKTTKETFDEDESERLLRGFMSKALFDAGLYCRADDRGDPVVQLAPPLICDQQHFDEIEQILRNVLTDAWTQL